LGKLAKSHLAADGPFESTAQVSTTQGRLEGAIGDALRASFKPVVDEPLPDKLQKMLVQLRAEEQQRKGH
jgi:hypothetical protein